MKKKQKKALYGETGRFLIDIAKYIITGALVTTLLNDFQGYSVFIYLIGILCTCIIFLIGLHFIKRREE